MQSHNVAAIQSSSAYGGPKGQLDPAPPQEAVYSPPSPCWVISSYTRVVMSAAGNYAAKDDAQPPNFSYLTSTSYSNELSSLKNYVGNLNIPPKVKADINVKLEEFVKNYASYASSIQTSHGQIRHMASTYRPARDSWPFMLRRVHLCAGVLLSPRDPGRPSLARDLEVVGRSGRGQVHACARVAHEPGFRTSHQVGLKSRA